MGFCEREMCRVSGSAENRMDAWKAQMAWSTHTSLCTAFILGLGKHFAPFPLGSRCLWTHKLHMAHGWDIGTPGILHKNHWKSLYRLGLSDADKPVILLGK